MHGLQTISIEYLCFAAEVTCALLLLALLAPASRRSKTSNDQIAQEPTPESLAHLASLRRALLSGVCYRGIALERGVEFEAIPLIDEIIAPFEEPSLVQEAKWEDRVSTLGNQAFAESFLGRWLDITSQMTTETCLSLISIEGDSDFLQQEGVFEFERNLRVIGRSIQEQISPGGLAFRVSPNRFLLVQFGLAPTAATSALLAIKQDFQAFVATDSNENSSGRHSNVALEIVTSTSSLDDTQVLFEKSQRSDANHDSPEAVKERIASPEDILDSLEQGIAKALDTGILDLVHTENSWTRAEVSTSRSDTSELPLPSAEPMEAPKSQAVTTKTTEPSGGDESHSSTADNYSGERIESPQQDAKFEETFDNSGVLKWSGKAEEDEYAPTNAILAPASAEDPTPVPNKKAKASSDPKQAADIFPSDSPSVSGLASRREVDFLVSEIQRIKKERVTPEASQAADLPAAPNALGTGNQLRSSSEDAIAAIPAMPTDS